MNGFEPGSYGVGSTAITTAQMFTLGTNRFEGPKAFFNVFLTE